MYQDLTCVACLNMMRSGDVGNTPEAWVIVFWNKSRHLSWKDSYTVAKSIGHFVWNHLVLSHRMPRFYVSDLHPGLGLWWCSTVHLSSWRGLPPSPGPEPRWCVHRETGVRNFEYPPSNQLPALYCYRTGLHENKLIRTFFFSSCKMISAENQNTRDKIQLWNVSNEHRCCGWTVIR